MGFGAGGWGGGPSSVQANAAAGLPFAGVPGPLQDAVEKAIEREPEHPERPALRRAVGSLGLRRRRGRLRVEGARGLGAHDRIA